MKLEGKNVVITGAGSGIGLEMARLFDSEGAQVAIIDADARAVAALADTLPSALALTCDVRDRDAMSAALEQVRARGPIDIVVNNAATCSDEPLDTISVDEWSRDIEVDLTAAFSLIQLALPDLRRQRGVVLNITSVNGLAYFGNEAYSAAKAGLISLTRSVAARYGREGIRANAIAPGTIVTPIWQDRLEKDPTVLDGATEWYPLGRLGTPHDVARAALFLCSDDAAWITGTTLVVDGGLTAGYPLMADRIVAEG